MILRNYYCLLGMIDNRIVAMQENIVFGDAC